jgi:hypothetical protein
MACGCAILLAVLGHARQARAEFITYSTTLIPPAALSVPIGSGVTIIFSPTGAGDPTDAIDATIPDGTNIVFGNIKVTGLTRTTPLLPVSIPYTFHVSVTNFTDDISGISTGPAVDFDISGTLGGTVGAVGGGKKANITNTYSQASIFEMVGGQPYTMSLFSFVAPDSINTGAFGAHIVNQAPTPEPATATLLGLGALALAVPAYRRWRRKPRTTGRNTLASS